MSESSGVPARWATPLPDFSRARLRHRIRIGARVFQIVVSEVVKRVPLEPDTHLVQAGVLMDNQPLTAFDLGLRSPEACANVWAYLTNRLTETVVQFYAPRPRELISELNPRLGCWGPRPDLVEQGLGEGDCAIALILGVSVWLPGSTPPVDDQTFLEALRDTLVEAITYWFVVAQRTAGPIDRRN